MKLFTKKHKTRDTHAHNEAFYPVDTFDEDGYNQTGLDEAGYDIEGYDDNGYDKQGYDRAGFDQRKKHRNNTPYDFTGFDSEGIYRQDAPLPNEPKSYIPAHEWCDTIREYKRQKRHEEALTILEFCMQTEEAHGGNVAPWFYEQAAIIHRKNQNKPAELEVLRRFARQPHAPGATPPKLLLRLSKLEATL